MLSDWHSGFILLKKENNQQSSSGQENSYMIRDTEIPEGFVRCDYCRAPYAAIFLHSMTVYYSHGFSRREVLQCDDCFKEQGRTLESKSSARNNKKNDSIGFAVTPVTWYDEAYDSICQAIRDLCSRSAYHIVNYYDAVKAAYLKETPKIENQFNPSFNTIFKNTFLYWTWFSIWFYRFVRNKAEERNAADIVSAKYDIFNRLNDNHLDESKKMVKRERV
jgi:hypothetical protein